MTHIGHQAANFAAVRRPIIKATPEHRTMDVGMGIDSVQSKALN
jgi:hypothetical protein